MDLGIIVLTNQQSGAAFSAITNSIKDGYFGIKDQDRVNEYNDNRLYAEYRVDNILAQVEKEFEKQLQNKKSKVDLADYAGQYKDPWFGKVTLTEQKDGLYFKAEKALDLVGKMTYYKGTTFVVRWDDRTLKADAYVNFILDVEGKAVGFKMSPISPLTDFSYNYQDLDFSRID